MYSSSEVKLKADLYISLCMHVLVFNYVPHSMW